MHYKDWKKWCRLCGKKNGSDIDVTLKFENTETLSGIIVKYFGIMISEESNCTKICIMCHDTINSIIKYNAHVVKVNEMFLELESNLNQNFNIEFIRKKYNLTSAEAFLHINEIRDDIFPIKLNTHEYEDKNSENKNNTSAEHLKTELVELNDSLSFCEDQNEDLDSESDVADTKFKNNSDLSDYLTSKDEFKCPNCEKCFKNQRYVKDHIRRVHTKQSFICDICNASFKSKKTLNNHYSTHAEEKKFKCPKCDKAFKVKRYVQDHIRLFHKKEKPFTCKVCEAAFENKNKLAEHNSFTHPGEKKYKCSRCEKAFKCKRDLKDHFAIHDGTGCICQVCGLKLNTRKILRIHMLVHSDQKRFKCNLCSKQFKRSNAYKNHLILHTGLKPYECPFCGLTFANGSNCRKHQRTTHAVELAAAELEGVKKLPKTMPSINELKALVTENKP